MVTSPRASPARLESFISIQRQQTWAVSNAGALTLMNHVVSCVPFGRGVRRADSLPATSTPERNGGITIRTPATRSSAIMHGVEKRKKRVAILFGGRSAEHEISVLSARFVAQSLDREKYEPVLVGINKDGRWLLQNEALLLDAARDPRLVRLNEAAPPVALDAFPKRSTETALAIVGRGETNIDVVFPVLHGPLGEDGSVQGLLELAGVPYVGAGVLGSAVGMDKDVMKRLLSQAGLPIVRHEVVRRVAYDRAAEAELNRVEELGYPVFVKPANLGSSVGISRATCRAELVSSIEASFQFDTKVIVEQGLDRPRELECAVLGDDDPVASVPGEVVLDHPDGFYSYAAKYIDEKGVTLRIPADVSDELSAQVRDLAVRAFVTLECTAMARIDFFFSPKEGLFVNEINTIPGFTAISMYPKLWEASGVSGRELVQRLIDIAIRRSERRRALKTSVDYHVP